MRTIRRTAAFKRDYKREKRGRFAKTLPEEIRAIVADLAADRALPRAPAQRIADRIEAMMKEETLSATPPPTASKPFLSPKAGKPTPRSKPPARRITSSAPR